MKLYFLTLLIGTIVALSDLGGRGNHPQRKRRGVPLVSDAVRIGRTCAQRRLQ
jgi:hypothetical protein